MPRSLTVRLQLRRGTVRCSSLCPPLVSPSVLAQEKLRSTLPSSLLGTVVGTYSSTYAAVNTPLGFPTDAKTSHHPLVHRPQACVRAWVPSVAECGPGTRIGSRGTVGSPCLDGSSAVRRGQAVRRGVLADWDEARMSRRVGRRGQCLRCLRWPGPRRHPRGGAHVRSNPRCSPPRFGARNIGPNDTKPCAASVVGRVDTRRDPSSTRSPAACRPQGAWTRHERDGVPRTKLPRCNSHRLDSPCRVSR